MDMIEEKDESGGNQFHDVYMRGKPSQQFSGWSINKQDALRHRSRRRIE